MFFVLSTGRSGTTTIARTLDKLSNCRAVHEPSPPLILESMRYHYGELPAECISKVLIETRYPFVGDSVYCESNQTLSLLVPVLAKTFPQARYIWQIRNGLDFVASAMQKQWYSGHSENKDKYEDCTPLEKAWIDGRIRADRCGEMNTKQWESLSRFGKCCWYWSYVNRTIETDLSHFANERYFFLRLEDINKRLAELLDWMDLKNRSAPSIDRHNIAKRTPYRLEHWTTEELNIFEAFCGDLMNRFYSDWRPTNGVWTRLKKRTEQGQKHRLLGDLISLAKKK